MEKSAQDIMETLRRVGSSVGDAAGSAGSSMADWYNNLNPEVRRAAIRGVLGAGAGAALTGGISAATPRDPDRRGGIMTPALTGAIMGGTAAAGLPAGLKMLGGDIRFPNERTRSRRTQAADAVLGPMIRRPATSAAAIMSGMKYGPGVLERIEGATGVGNLSKDNIPKLLPRALAKTKAGVKAVPGSLKAIPGKGKIGIPLALLAGMTVDHALRGGS